MKILLLTGSMDVSAGGPPRVVAGSAIGLASQGHEVKIASLASLAAPEEKILEDFSGLATPNISLHVYPASLPHQLGRSAMMQRDLPHMLDGCSAVHVHGVWEQCLADVARAATKLGIPVFVSAHGMLDPWSMRQSRWKKVIALRLLGTGKMLRSAKAIIYGTQDERQDCASVLPGSASAIVPNGIALESLSLDQLPDDTDLLRRFPQLADWQTTILFFSRIHPKKGVNLLIDAFLACAPEAPGAGLLIAGIAQDAEFETLLRRKISDSSYADRIIFTTDLSGEEARVVFRQSEIFALPSHQEGFSMAILEAMALEKPLLITDRCHLPDVSGSWACGVVVKDDIAGITEGLRELLAKTPDALNCMGQNGRRVVEQNFSWDAVARKLGRLYRGEMS
ncbi:glycosyltransferase [uncultured Erythrobacter sp.]|uniref:glycosyltransferase n=1 Tax=uncultured Erythrobacter sp. TaxID=263913 RepID=UPI002659350C|nr:glycosyltransferase [uncultured Erythrobacter sp.]